MPHRQERIALPAMTPGTRRSIALHRFGRAGARPKAYLQAAIHANELPGAMALHHLMPSMPYHDLPEAHRRLRKQLGQGSTYEGANHPGMLHLVGRIARSTMTAR